MSFPHRIVIPEYVQKQIDVITEWDIVADDYDEFGDKETKWTYDLIREHLQITPDMVVLDFGCATGQLANLLRRHVKKVLAIDASSRMVEICEEKIEFGGWKNVRARRAVLGLPSDPDTQEILRENAGTFDLIVASAVFRFVVPETVGTTMAALGWLLKPGGYLCHADWSQSGAKDDPGAVTTAKAQLYYQKAGLESVFTSMIQCNLEDPQDVFLGIAQKRFSRLHPCEFEVPTIPWSG